nr:MAG TPA: hypothetical protein [Bacteriophage sp.]
MEDRQLSSDIKGILVARYHLRERVDRIQSLHEDHFSNTLLLFYHHDEKSNLSNL